MERVEVTVQDRRGLTALPRGPLVGAVIPATALIWVGVPAAARSRAEAEPVLPTAGTRGSLAARSWAIFEGST